MMDYLGGSIDGSIDGWIDEWMGRMEGADDRIGVFSRTRFSRNQKGCRKCVAGAPQSEPPVIRCYLLGARFGPQPPLFKIS
uniref:Uncharacterized protein n=1 Tax=Candidatus Kentrum sp. UNK TaxID=2126344 RepID=A0A451AE41_9GAMM|nr:MAG: hypothetical protein BECKUNK1418G_GA0071005_104422 [Candidatus Kentron sp. UNK]VFK71058.1 MAG: hypothetical protein BECKUNK1418H_GA0071006_104822 [Candidatus Kentron sp. UNK]